MKKKDIKTKEESKAKKNCELILDHNPVWAGDGYFCSKCGLKFISENERKKAILKVLEKVRHCLGMWVSSEYMAEHYEDKCISPKDFWNEWLKLEEELLKELNQTK